MSHNDCVRLARWCAECRRCPWWLRSMLLRLLSIVLRSLTATEFCSVHDMRLRFNVFLMPRNVWKVCRRGVGVARTGNWGSTRIHERQCRLVVPTCVAIALIVCVLLLALDPHPATTTRILLAAPSGTAIFDVQTGGSDNNGGGFNAAGSSPGTDYSTSATPHVNIDGTVISATVQATTTQLKFGGTSGYTTAATDNRNFFQITGGTATAGFYEIIAVTAGAPGTGVWTADRSMGTNGQTIIGNMGGSLASPGKAGGAASVAGMSVYIQTGTYTVTSTSTNVAGGCVSLGNARQRWEGYGTTHGDLGPAPSIEVQVGLSIGTIFTTAANEHFVRNLQFDAHGQSSFRCVTAANRSIFHTVKALNGTNSGFGVTSATAYLYACTASGCAVGGFTTTVGCVLFACEAYDGTATGFSSSGNAVFVRCISDSNIQGNACDGYTFTTGGGVAINCVAYNNDRHGFNISVAGAQCVNCIAESNVSNGYNGATNGNNSLLNCADYNNGARSSNIFLDMGPITGSSTFFADAPDGDFRLNTTSTGGGLLRAKGFPGAFERGTMVGYLDVGAVQGFNVPPPVAFTVSMPAVIGDGALRGMMPSGFDPGV